MREHLQIVRRTHAQTLRLKLLALLAQLGHTLVEFPLDRIQRLRHAFGTGNVVRSREDVHVTDLLDHVAGERVQCGDAVDLVAEELDAYGQLLIHRDDLHRVAPHAEGAARECDVVALVLHVDEGAQQIVAINLVSLV